MKKKENSQLIYGFIGISGIILIFASFLIEHDNWSSILSGLGTGAVSSLIVSLLINKAIDKRLENEKNATKSIIFSDLQYAAKVAYCSIINDVNEFIVFTDSEKLNYVYNVYDERTSISELFRFLDTVDYNNLSEEERSKYNKLFRCMGYIVDRLNAEIKSIPKEDYFIRGILSESEMKSLYTNFQFEKYNQCVEKKNEYWKSNQIVNYNNCLQLLKFTLLISSRIIATFPECKKKVIIEEEIIKEQIDELYYREVYCQSEEYIQNEIERIEAEQEYLSEHPEILEELATQYEQWENETPTDRLIQDMERLFNGFFDDSFEELLKRADKNDDKIIRFFKRKDIKKIINKRKYKKTLIKIYGKDYFDKIK